MELSIEHYIATNNPQEANNFVVRHGLPRPKNWDDLIKKMRYVMVTEKQGAFDDLMQIDTPYKRAIIDTVAEKKSGACGCSASFNGEESSNCSGCQGCPKIENSSSADASPTSKQITSDSSVVKKDEQHSKFIEYAPLATIVLLGGILIALIAKK